MFAEPDSTVERHFSVEELATLWKMSPDFTRRLFLRESGVVMFCNPRRGKRVYRTIRIPTSVMQRVHQRLTQIGDIRREAQPGRS